MLPVDQTRESETGNCFGAAMASILEVSLDDVPDITGETIDGKNWMTYITSYLFKHHSLLPIELDGRLIPFVTPNGYHIISGNSPRNEEWGHATVGYQGKIVHDPHPSRAGLTKVLDYTFFVPINLDVLEGRHREAMLAWVNRAPCICRVCKGASHVPILDRTGMSAGDRCLQRAVVRERGGSPRQH